MSAKDIQVRNNVRFLGKGPRTVMLAHGFGCDQNVWRFLTPALAESYQVVLFDYVGCGQSRLSAFSRKRYSELEGYAQDVLEICDAFDLNDITFIGHSVSSMIGLIATLEAPERFREQIMVCPSPCYLEDPPEYHGGFSKQDLNELLDLMDKNYIGWANYLAPISMGPEAPEALSGELSGSFCSTDPMVAKIFAKATFFSDCRDLLPKAQHPALILQSRSDDLANPSVGEFVHRQMPESQLHVMDTEGHCIHMSHPKKVEQEILAYLSR